MHRLQSLSTKNITLAAALISLPMAEPATAQTAGDVMTKMTAEQRVSYINGVIEGLAISRWLQDKPDSTGMKCIYDWRYENPKKNSYEILTKWLENNPKHAPGGLIYLLLKRECPLK